MHISTYHLGCPRIGEPEQQCLSTEQFKPVAAAGPCDCAVVQSSWPVVRQVTADANIAQVGATYTTTAHWQQSECLLFINYYRTLGGKWPIIGE